MDINSHLFCLCLTNLEQYLYDALQLTKPFDIYYSCDLHTQPESLGYFIFHLTGKKNKTQMDEVTSPRSYSW